MLSRRDREMASEIGFQSRHGPTGAPFGGPMPAVLAWPLAGLAGYASYYLRDAHSLFWGSFLFIAALCVAFHAVYRQEVEGSKLANVFFLFLYSVWFFRIISALWVRGYVIWTALIGLAAFVTLVSMVKAVLRRPLAQ